MEWYGLEEFPQALCTQCGWDSRDGCPVDPEPGLPGRGAQGPLYENNMRGAGIVENGHIGRAEFRELMRRLGMGDYSDEIHADAATFDDIERDKKIKTEAQLSLIGGTMGLLTGFSIISGIEIIFFLFRSSTTSKINRSESSPLF